MRVCLLLTLVVFAAPSLALAQANAPKPREIVIDDADLISVEVPSPEIESIDLPVRPKHKPNIKVRADFAREAMASVSEL